MSKYAVCPSCNVKYMGLKNEYAGRSNTCKKCGTKFTIKLIDDSVAGQPQTEAAPPIPIVNGNSDVEKLEQKFAILESEHELLKKTISVLRDRLNAPPTNERSEGAVEDGLVTGKTVDEIMVKCEIPEPKTDGAQEGSYKPQSIEDVEKEQILKALSYAKWHKGKACDILGITRPRLERKIEKYGLKPSKLLYGK